MNDSNKIPTIIGRQTSNQKRSNVPESEPNFQSIAQQVSYHPAASYFGNPIAYQGNPYIAQFFAYQQSYVQWASTAMNGHPLYMNFPNANHPQLTQPTHYG